MSFPLGIDLGTTYSAISRWVNQAKGFSGSVPYNLNSQGSTELASSVFIDEEDGITNPIVGKAALKQGTLYPDQKVQAVKRKMDNADFRYQILGKEYSPIDISAEIIKKLLWEVEKQEGPGTFVPKGIVVTVPYYFKQHQNFNTQQAALQAISEVFGSRMNNLPTENLFLGLLAEPVAVGLDHAFNREKTGKETILVFDLGGGTFDLTVFSLEQELKRLKFEVMAVDGNDRLGGEDFDQSFFQWLCLEQEINLDALDEKSSRRALKKIHPIINEAKHQLSLSKRTEIIIPQVIGTQSIDMDPVKRPHFEDCITGKSGAMRNYLEEINFKLDSVMEKAGLAEREVDTILLAGGSSQIPIIHNLLVEKFGEGKIRDAANIRLAVSRGAAIYAAFKLDKAAIEAGNPPRYLTQWDEIEIGEVTAHQLGLEIGKRFDMFLRDNQLTPCSKTNIFEPTILSEDGERAVLKKIRIVQGTPNDYSLVGEVEVDDIYTHGRPLCDMSIKITFIADPTLVKIRIFADKGNADGSNYVREADLKLQ